MLKSLFYQVWTYFYNLLFFGDETFRIGIGISSLSVDSVSIQFIHHIWTQRGLEQESNHGVRKIYKKILFAYFEMCENYLFKKKGLKFFSPAHFLTNYLKDNYTGIEAKTIYSGVNLSRFEINKKPKIEILNDLVTRYPILKGLNVSKPIYLFIGAYERKGLPQALEIVSQVKGCQFIVIGSPSAGKPVVWPKDINVYPITFTREVPLFYSLSDAFIFPTIYEPFGLVLFEAMAMGLAIVTRFDQVGASELLKGLPEVYFSDEKDFSFVPVEVKDLNAKMHLRNERIKLLGDVSWSKAGAELANFI
ncbi:MAG: glycosyltransferase family 4 protein [Bacteriovoracaceae bacterium]|nr:glycosyltransferase family 4 protein [Bacteriovoracaceae bacterium]